MLWFRALGWCWAGRFEFGFTVLGLWRFGLSRLVVVCG